MCLEIRASTGMAGSLYESLVWEQLTGYESVSTISILQRASEQGTDILILTKENLQTELEKLHTDRTTKENVISAVNSGKSVTIPATAVINYAKWIAIGALLDALLVKLTEFMNRPGGGSGSGSVIKSIQSKSPQQLIAEGWEDITNPKMAANTTSREFYDPKSGLKIRFDKGVDGANGFEAVDHYHVMNPNYTNKKVDYFLDIDGKPVGKGSKASHFVIKGEE